MYNRYILYAVMTDGSKYRLNCNSRYLDLLNGILKGLIIKDNVEYLNDLPLNQVDFIQKLCNGKCDYLFVKDRNTQLKVQIKPNELFEN